MKITENHSPAMIDSRRDFLSALGAGAASLLIGADAFAEGKLPAARLNDLKISERGLELIKSFESLKLEAYRCSAGVWTIGYGHTRTAREGMKLSGEAQAIDLLRSDIEIHQGEVSKTFESKKVALTQCQFDALSSAVFNVNCLKGGSSGFARFLIRKLPELADADGIEKFRINKEIVGYLCRYNRAGGKALDGLTRRRLSEGLLFAGVEEPLVTIKEFNSLKAAVKNLKPAERAEAMVDRLFVNRGLS